jgi:hypothetical protein
MGNPCPGDTAGAKELDIPAFSVYNAFVIQVANTSDVS